MEKPIPSIYKETVCIDEVTFMKSRKDGPLWLLSFIPIGEQSQTGKKPNRNHAKTPSDQKYEDFS